MTDPNYMHISVLIDESGSMGGLADDTRGGFNTFLKEQLATPGKATMTLCTFSSGHSMDDRYKVLSKMANLDSVPPLTTKNYSPMGGTALHDALGKCIHDTGRALAAMGDDDRPGKVMFMVITDGHENASNEFSKDTIASMIKTQESDFSWTFVYLGANVDAFSEGNGIGVRSSNVLNYAATSGGVARAYNVMSRSVGTVRSVTGEAKSSYCLYDASANVSDIGEVQIQNLEAAVRGATEDSDSVK